mgnify:CR=1 FL=1
MGIIQAFSGAIRGTFADQWKEIITAGDFDEYSAVVPGVLKKSNNGRGTNFYGSEGVISEGSKIEADTAMAVILSAMFGLGMVLKSYIQGNPKYQGASQSGLASYIFGQAAYILREDVYIILAVSVISLALFILFYKEIKVYVFDMVYAYTIGINSRLTSLLIMIITMILIAAGLKAVGAILISSMLITPAVTGLQWSKSYEKVLMIAALTGAVSAFLGTFISSAVKGFSTGPSIILIMSVIALFSVLFAPRGIVRMLLNIRKMRVGK